MPLEDALQSFASKHRFLKSKGALSLALILTRLAKDETFPLQEADFVTAQGGQVKGLSGEAAQKILAEHGIHRVLAREGGRTSRGSIGNMQNYLALLNQLQADEPSFDLEVIEKWWIEQVKNYFAASPLRLKLDPSLTLQAAIRSVLLEAKKRQQESTGTQVVGTVIQHLVGAKLETLYPEKEIQHHGANVADTSSQRTGDFSINDTVIHVTTSPSESLLQTCQKNIQQGHSPLIVTTANGIVTIQTLTAGTPLENRIETVELEQFLVVNLAERAAFDPASRKGTVEHLLEAYNRIIDECETDPGLKIEIA